MMIFVFCCGRRQRTRIFQYKMHEIVLRVRRVHVSLCMHARARDGLSLSHCLPVRWSR